MVADVKFIITIDATSFFYQFLVSEQDCDKFTVISYQGQEYFKMATIGFKNNPDGFEKGLISYFIYFGNLLEPTLMTFLYFSRNFKEHVVHLYCIFLFFKVLIYSLIQQSHILDIH